MQETPLAQLPQQCYTQQAGKFNPFIGKELRLIISGVLEQTATQTALEEGSEDPASTIAGLCSSQQYIGCSVA